LLARVARRLHPRRIMTDPRPGDTGGQVPENRYRDAEAQLGGADAVEKTTYVTGRGTTPEDMPARGAPIARTPSRAAPVAVWIVLIVVAMLAVAYIGGTFR
jgi:hypothetical protein